MDGGALEIVLRAFVPRSFQILFKPFLLFSSCHQQFFLPQASAPASKVVALRNLFVDVMGSVWALKGPTLVVDIWGFSNLYKALPFLPFIIS